MNLDQAITNMLDEAQEYQEQENDRRIAQEDEDREVRARGMLFFRLQLNGQSLMQANSCS